MLTGEFSRSMELIKQNIQNLEYQFGSFSVEVMKQNYHVSKQYKNAYNTYFTHYICKYNFSFFN